MRVFSVNLVRFFERFSFERREWVLLERRRVFSFLRKVFIFVYEFD